MSLRTVRSAKYLLFSLLLLPVMLGAAFSPRAAASTDCDNNAVIYCGVSSVGGLVHKYMKGDKHNRNGSIADIYSAFGISANDIQAMRGNVRTGTVTKSGDIYVGGKLVASNAVTAGRQYMSGSNSRSNGNTTFYTRSPSVSFRSDRLQAFVVMQGDNFRFAILTSCGNPVIATPHHPQKPPKHHPQHPGISPNRPVSHHHHKHPPKPTTVTNTTNNTNTSVCSGDTTNSNSGVASQSGNCSTNTTTNTTNTDVTTTVNRTTPNQPQAPPSETEETQTAPPTETSAPETVPSAPASTTAPATLPNTGPGGILGVFGATTAIGTLAYRAYLRRQLGKLQ